MIYQLLQIGSTTTYGLEDHNDECSNDIVFWGGGHCMTREENADKTARMRSRRAINTTRQGRSRGCVHQPIVANPKQNVFKARWPSGLRR